MTASTALPLLRATSALLITAALAACGGGDHPPAQPSTAGPAASAQAPRAIPASTTRATALLDWAERKFPNYFPSHRPDQFAAPYIYRHYPETGIYLGVDGTQVYVMGGPFGASPVYVGQVGDFLPATPSAPPGTGNGCWDLDFMETPGRHIVVESRTTTTGGSVIGGMTQEWRVLGQRSFEGRSLLATATTVTLTLATGATASVQRNTSYTQRASAGGVTIHGDEGSMSMGAVNASFRTVFNPPWTDTQHVLSPGQSVTQTWSGTTTSQGQTSPLQGSRSIRFVTRETITVPAGTFETCRFEQTQASTTGPMTTWIARGWGVPVQVQGSATSPGGITRAVRISVDGANIDAAAAASAAHSR